MKKLLSLAMLTALLFAAGCDDDDKNKCPSTCTNGCEADGKTCKASGNTCPSTCTNGCEADGVTCKASGNTCPSTCTNGCEADGTTCKPDNNNLDAGIDPVPEGQPTSGECDPNTFVNYCKDNKQVSCYGDANSSGHSVHENACDSEYLCVTIKEESNYNYCMPKCDGNVGDTRKACSNDDDGRDILQTQECRNSKNGKVWNVKEVQICSTVCMPADDASGEDSCGAEEACTNTEGVTCDDNEVAYQCEEFEGKTVKTVVQCGIFGEVCFNDYGCDEDEED